MEPKQEEIENKLKEGLNILIRNWPVLKLAIENNWGSKNKQKLKESKEVNPESILSIDVKDIPNQLIKQLTD